MKIYERGEKPRRRSGGTDEGKRPDLGPPEQSDSADGALLPELAEPTDVAPSGTHPLYGLLPDLDNWRRIGGISATLVGVSDRISGDGP